MAKWFYKSIRNFLEDYDSDLDGILDVAAIPDLTRSKITDFFDSPFWGNIPDKPTLMERVASLTVTTDSAQVTITGLDHERLLILGHFHNADPEATGQYRIFFNGDTIQTNYYAEVLEISGTNVSADIANDCVFAKAEAHGRAPFIIYIARPQGWTGDYRFLKAICLNVYNNGTSTTLRITGLVRQVDEDVNITQLDFATVSGANRLSAGSRIRVYYVP